MPMLGFSNSNLSVEDEGYKKRIYHRFSSIFADTDVEIDISVDDDVDSVGAILSRNWFCCCQRNTKQKKKKKEKWKHSI